MKKTLAILLSMVLMLSVMPLGLFTVTASAEETNGVQLKLDELRAVYDTGTYFTVNGEACTDYACYNCSLSNIPSKGGLPAGSSVSTAIGNGYSCNGFARYAFYYIFGDSFFSGVVVDTPSVGDVIENFYGYDSEGNPMYHFSIYLGEDENYWYVYDSNGYSAELGGASNCMVQYYTPLSKAHNPLNRYWHAYNYDEVFNQKSIKYSTINEGIYYIQNDDTAKYLAVDNRVNHNNVILTDYPDEFDSEYLVQVQITRVSGTHYKIRPLSSDSKLINPDSYYPKSGNNINIYDDVGTIDQWWGFEKSGDSYIIRNKLNQNCVLSYDTSTDMDDVSYNVKLDKYSGSSEQMWTLIPISGTVEPEPEIKDEESGEYESLVNLQFEGNEPYGIVGTYHHDSEEYKYGTHDNKGVIVATDSKYNAIRLGVDGNAGSNVGIKTSYANYTYEMAEQYGKAFEMQADTTYRVKFRYKIIAGAYNNSEECDYNMLNINLIPGSGYGDSSQRKYSMYEAGIYVIQRNNSVVLDESNSVECTDEAGKTYYCLKEDTDWIEATLIFTTGHSVEWPQLNLRLNGGIGTWCLDYVTVEKSLAIREAGIEYVVSDGKAIITGCDTTFAGTLTIPETIDGYPVVRIDTKAFYGYDRITDVILPEGLTSIGGYAFANCPLLKSVSLPDSLELIWGSAFKNCSSLKSVVIPSKITIIHTNVFEGCQSLESVVLPEGLQTIAAKAFYGCTSLKSIRIPSTVHMAQGSPTCVGKEAFTDCTSLSDITVYDAATTIDGSAFYNTAFYNNADNWVNGCLYLGNHLIAVDRSTVQGEFTIKDGTKSIAYHAAENCDFITMVNIPEGVESIGYNAFAYCTALHSISIPSTMTYMGSDICVGSEKVNTIHYNGTKADWDKIEIRTNEQLLSAEIRYTYGMVSEGSVRHEGVDENGNYQSAGIRFKSRISSEFRKSASELGFVAVPTALLGDMTVAEYMALENNQALTAKVKGDGMQEKIYAVSTDANGQKYYDYQMMLKGLTREGVAENLLDTEITVAMYAIVDGETVYTDTMSYSYNWFVAMTSK